KSDSAAALVLDHVQAALLLHRPCPAAGALVLAVADGPRAGPAADARVAPVVQRVVGHLVLDDERPHLAPRPGKQRVDLHQAELPVPLHHAGGGPTGRVVPGDGADPGVVPSDRPPQGQDLAVVTALVGPDAVQRTAVLRLVLRHAQLRPDVLDLDAVTALD